MKSILFILFLLMIVEGKAESPSSLLLKMAHSTPAYKLSKHKWLVFPLSSQSYETKVSTYADIPLNIPWDPNKRWLYKIQVQAVSLNGIVIESRYLEYRSQWILYKSPDLGTYSPSFYLEKDAQPTLVNFALLNWSDKERAAFVRVRLVSEDIDVLAVYCRVFEKANVIFRNLLNYWYHLSPSNQTQLAGGNIYDSFHLSQEEKENIIGNLWKPIGPQGIPHKSFQEKLLYQIEPPEGVMITKSIQPAGTYISENRYVVIFIPEKGASLTFFLLPLDPLAKNSPSILDLKWYGRKITDPLEVKLETNEEGKVTHFFEKGFLVASTLKPLILRAEDEEGQQLLAQQPLSAKGYKIDENHSLEYSISHQEGQPTPFRFDFRKIMSTPNDTHSQRISYEFLDEKGTILKKGSFLPSIAFSFYDYLSQDPLILLSNAFSSYFVVSEDVKKLRFISKDPFYIAAYNRPLNLARNFDIPGDYYTSGSPEESVRRPWFYVSPVDADQRERNGQVLLFLTQPQPIEQDPNVRLGIYEWKQFFPKENWLSTFLFVPKDPDFPQVDQAQEVTYTSLIASTKSSFYFQGLKGMKFIRPNLTYFKEKEAPESLVVKVDESEIYNETISGTHGNIQLSPISIGKHFLSIKSPTHIKIFMNQLVNKENNYLKRQAIQLGKQEVLFIYEKKVDNEAVTLTLDLFGRSQSYTKVAFKIEGPSPPENIPLVDYTIRKRNYDIFFSGDSVIFLNEKKERYCSAEPIFIKLGSDLPKGTYSITLRSSDLIYGLLSQLTPGLHNRSTTAVEIIPFK
ncbi:MAG: hypothetical protein KBD76_08450 [Bacteriovorax sp.]|nr:hypothetical protein [Bacteriovorax sp.]